jgi:ELWxxDGT repeat protein
MDHPIHEESNFHQFFARKWGKSGSRLID